MLEMENGKREMQAEQGGAAPGTGSCICYSIWEHGGGKNWGGGIGCSQQPYGRGQGGSLGTAAGGPGFSRRKRCCRVPSPWAHGAARSCLWCGSVGRCRPSCAASAFPALFIARHDRQPPRPHSRRLLLPQPWGGRRGAEPPAGETHRKRGWSSRVSPHRVCCKAPPAGSVPQERQKQAPSSPQTHWGCWEAHTHKQPPHPKLPCLRRWGSAPEQAASPGSEAAPGRRAHAFQRGVIGALCHSDAYNWRCIV